MPLLQSLQLCLCIMLPQMKWLLNSIIIWFKNNSKTLVSWILCEARTNIELFDETYPHHHLADIFITTCSWILCIARLLTIIEPAGSRHLYNNASKIKNKPTCFCVLCKALNQNHILNHHLISNSLLGSVQCFQLSSYSQHIGWQNLLDESQK